MAAQSLDRPVFWIVAGPNGSGKSTLYSGSEIQGFDGTIWIINPDRLAARIRDIENLELTEANLEAVRRIERWLEDSIWAHQTVGVETVLSTDKYRRLVTEAKKLAFEVRLIFVVLRSPDLNVARVKRRVVMGGHDVPEDRIRARYYRSLDQLPWFLEAADLAWIYDNSEEDAAPLRIGEKKNGVVELDPNAIPEIVAAVQKIATT